MYAVVHGQGELNACWAAANQADGEVLAGANGSERFLMHGLPAR